MTITDVPLLVSLSEWVGADIGFAQPTSIIGATSEHAIPHHSHAPKGARDEDEFCENIGVLSNPTVRL